MFKLRVGYVPKYSSRLSAGTAAIVVAVALGACSSSKQAATPDAQWRVNGPPTQLAKVAPPPVVMEDDGIEAQIPPRVKAKPMPDDPTEPWSPNYGTVPIDRTAQAQPPSSAVEDVPAWSAPRQVADAAGE